MSNRLAFTQSNIAAIKPPETGRAFAYDAKTPGLALVTTSGGVKSFYFIRWVQGRSLKLFLGHFPAMTISAARKTATSMLDQANRGQVPKKIGAGQLTLGQLWATFEKHWMPYLRERTRKTDTDRYNACLKSLERKRLSAITREHVVTLHLKLGEARGHVMANRAIQLLRRLFNYAIVDLKQRTLDNPARGIRLFSEEKRERFLLAKEMPAWFAALEAEPEHMRDFFLLCLYTGARKTNVQQMRWSHLDLGERIWTIPKEEFKTGKAKVVVLSAPAVEILLRRQASAASDFVFPSRSASGHLVEPKKSWAAVCKRAGIGNLRIHDLRRSLGSWQASLGASLPIIGKSLGHDSPASTAIYARLELDPVRASVEAATAAMLAHRTPKQIEDKTDRERPA